MELEGASVLVTGGASGIGEASARRLTVLGARPVICDLNEEKGKAVAAVRSGARQHSSALASQVVQQGL